MNDDTKYATAVAESLTKEIWHNKSFYFHFDFSSAFIFYFLNLKY